MKKLALLFISLLSLILFSSCDLDDESYLRIKNQSFNNNYQDIITDVYLCVDATEDNYFSVWNGKLTPGSNSKFKVEPGEYGIKINVTRKYNSGINAEEEYKTGYKEPIEFDNYYTIEVIFDGNGITAKEYDE